MCYKKVVESKQMQEYYKYIVIEFVSLDGCRGQANASLSRQRVIISTERDTVSVTICIFMQIEESVYFKYRVLYS